MTHIYPGNFTLVTIYNETYQSQISDRLGTFAARLWKVYFLKGTFYIHEIDSVRETFKEQAPEGLFAGHIAGHVHTKSDSATFPSLIYLFITTNVF